jgi:hypothetical protein
MVGDAIKFANIFLNKLGAVEASSVIGCLERPFRDATAAGEYARPL